MEAWNRKQPKKKPALLQRNQHGSKARQLTPEQSRPKRTRANQSVPLLPLPLLLIPSAALRLWLFLLFLLNVVCPVVVVGLVAGVVGCRGSRTRSRSWSRSRSPPSLSLPPLLLPGMGHFYVVCTRCNLSIRFAPRLCPRIHSHSSAAPSSGVLLMLVIAAAAAAPVPAAPVPAAAVRVALCCCFCSLVVAVEIFTTYVGLFHYL